MNSREFEDLRIREDMEAFAHAIHDEAALIHERQGPKALTEGQLAVYCVETFFGLTCNGGFQSGFYGSYEWIVPHVSDALQRVGLVEYGITFDNAVSKFFPKRVPTDEDDYEQKIDDIYDEFEESDLSDEYEDPFEIHEAGFWDRYNEDKTEFRRALYHYILTNREEFVIGTIGGG